MQFQSTRDPNTIVSSSEAILRGLAPDGGLSVPLVALADVLPARHFVPGTKP